MKTAEVIGVPGVQYVKLPDEFRLCGSRDSIRQSGDAVILEPIKPTTWPSGFFEEIRSDDPAFTRPE